MINLKTFGHFFSSGLTVLIVLIVMPGNLHAAENRALNKPVTASSEGLRASNAVDGNANSRWGSIIGIDPSWIAVDLGRVYDLSSVVIDWEAANAEVYEIQGSNDATQWSRLVTQTGGKFGNRTDTITVSGAYRYVRIYGLKRSVGNNWGYSIWELKVYGTERKIVQRTIHNVTASSELQPASNAIDGSMTSRWESTHRVDPSWIRMDLGQSYNLAGLVIDWEAANPDTYEVQGSNDDRTWISLLTRTGGTFGNRTDTLDLSGNYRFLRIYCTQRSPRNDWGYSVFNLKVYSSESPENNPTDPNGTDFKPLFTSSTVLEPNTVVDTPAALITRFADRARDRHAREDQFRAYDHYLTFYWEHRTAQIEIVDQVAKGGNQVIFNVRTEWPLGAPEFRAFYRGINTVAEYWHNALMTRDPADALKYRAVVNFNAKEGRPIRIGDRMEIEISQFLANPPRGRANYYGTTYLYLVGIGIVPWEARGVFGNPNTEREDSYPIPVTARLGGNTTIHHQYTDEPAQMFKQMATNTSNINGQLFMIGRRVFNTDMGNGANAEAGNPLLQELANKLGRNYINRSCVGCHQGNGRGLPPVTGAVLRNYSVKVGDVNGNPHPVLGSVLQPLATLGQPEGSVWIQSWLENNGLRRPTYAFSNAKPETFSARITPQLVGAGLLEAIPESAIKALADASSTETGISGRMNIVTDLQTGEPRVGRFGWKASKATLRQQIADAFNSDMGVTSSVKPNPDCGPAQTNCGNNGAVLKDEDLDSAVAYIALLGVRAQRNSESPRVQQGQRVFNETKCTSCHTPTFTTSPFHPRAELRNQVIHPYTDLLLHDMGPELEDNLKEGNASGAEWRTAPLWNIGLTAGVSGGEAYLHDGRARTLQEAIQWHGGEAANSRAAYNSLSTDSRDALIEFLKSL